MLFSVLLFIFGVKFSKINPNRGHRHSFLVTKGSSNINSWHSGMIKIKRPAQRTVLRRGSEWCQCHHRASMMAGGEQRSKWNCSPNHGRDMLLNHLLRSHQSQARIRISPRRPFKTGAEAELMESCAFLFWTLFGPRLVVALEEMRVQPTLRNE